MDSFEALREARRRTSSQDNIQRGKELNWLISRLLDSVPGSKAREKAEQSFENWCRGNPRYEEIGREIVKHVLQTHGPSDRSGECLVCLVKVMQEKAEAAMKDPLRDPFSPLTNPFTQMLLTDPDIMAIAMTTKRLA